MYPKHSGDGFQQGSDGGTFGGGSQGFGGSGGGGFQGFGGSGGGGFQGFGGSGGFGGGNTTLGSGGGSFPMIDESKDVGGKDYLQANPNVGVSSPSEEQRFSTFKGGQIQLNRNITYADPTLSDNSEPIGGGGTKWHEFTPMTFPNIESVQKYQKQTGLDMDTNVSQDWGGGSGKLYRSRRGSIGGFAEMSDGTVSAFRWSSYPTSAALKGTNKDAQSFQENYEQAADVMTTRAKNSVGTSQTINAVASDIGTPQLTSQGFELQKPSFASGFSGKGTLESEMGQTEIYHSTHSTSIGKGHKGTPAETYHSEGMAMTIHEQVRGEKVSDQPNTVAMVTSIPNQVCRNCSDMFITNLGQNSLASGMPGLPFKGQKPGIEQSSSLGKGTSIKSEPISELQKSKTNLSEVEAIRQWHTQ